MTTKIAIVGCDASGKTVLISALSDYYKAGSRPDQACFLVPADTVTRRYADNLHRVMRINRTWPQATNDIVGGSTLNWSMIRDGKELLEIKMMDFGGENFRYAFRDDGEVQNPEVVEQLRAYIADADFVVVTVGMDKMLRNLTPDVYRDLSNGDIEYDRDSEAQWVTNGLLKLAAAKLAGDPPGLVVALTQADKHRDALQQSGGAKALFAQCWPMIAAMYPTLNVVAVASVDRMSEDGQPADGYRTDGVLPIMREFARFAFGDADETCRRLDDLRRTIGEMVGKDRPQDFVDAVDRYRAALEELRDRTAIVQEPYAGRLAGYAEFAAECQTREQAARGELERQELAEASRRQAEAERFEEESRQRRQRLRDEEEQRRLEAEREEAERKRQAEEVARIQAAANAAFLKMALKALIALVLVGGGVWLAASFVADKSSAPQATESEARPEPPKPAPAQDAKPEPQADVTAQDAERAKAVAQAQAEEAARAEAQRKAEELKREQEAERLRREREQAEIAAKAKAEADARAKAEAAEREKAAQLQRENERKAQEAARRAKAEQERQRAEAAQAEAKRKAEEAARQKAEAERLAWETAKFVGSLRTALNDAALEPGRNLLAELSGRTLTDEQARQLEYAKAFLDNLAKAKGGEREAMVWIGNQFYSAPSGTGIAANPLRAFDWYKRAAELDSPQAHYFLSLMIEQGVGSKRDEALSGRYCLKAARLGYAEAMFWVGAYCLEGTHGFEKSPATAHKFLTQAKAAGFANENLDAMIESTASEKDGETIDDRYPPNPEEPPKAKERRLFFGLF